MFWWLIDRCIKDRVIKPIPNKICPTCGKPETDREKLMRAIMETHRGVKPIKSSAEEILLDQIQEIMEDESLDDTWVRAQVTRLIQRHSDAIPKKG